MRMPRPAIAVAVPPGLPRSSRNRTRSRRSAGDIVAARPVGHQRAERRDFLDRRLWRSRTFSPVVASRTTSSSIRLGLLVALDDLAVVGGDGDRRVALLDLAPRPEQRLDDLLGREADSPAVVSSGPTIPPSVADLVARDASEPGIEQDLGPAPRITRLPGLGDQRGDVAGQVAGCGLAGRSACGTAAALAAGRGGTGVRGFGRRAGRLAVELRHQPVEAVEIVAQPLLGVVLRVAEDADRAAVAAVADDLQQLEVELALAQRQDLPADLVAAGVHAVEVQGHAGGASWLRSSAGKRSRWSWPWCRL